MEVACSSHLESNQTHIIQNLTHFKALPQHLPGETRNPRKVIDVEAGVLTQTPEHEALV